MGTLQFKFFYNLLSIILITIKCGKVYSKIILYFIFLLPKKH